MPCEELSSQALQRFSEFSLGASTSLFFFLSGAT